MRFAVREGWFHSWLDDLAESFTIHHEVAGVDGVHEESGHDFDGAILWFVDLSGTKEKERAPVFIRVVKEMSYEVTRR